MTSRSRKAKAVPEYAANSSQLKRDLASEVSMCRTTSVSKSSLVVNSRADCMLGQLASQGQKTSELTNFLHLRNPRQPMAPPRYDTIMKDNLRSSLWLRNACLHALDLLLSKARCSSLVLWPRDTRWFDRVLQIRNGSRSALLPLSWSRRIDRHDCRGKRSTQMAVNAIRNIL